MRFRCGETWQHERERRKPEFEAAKQWHRVFCWWPKTLHVEDGYYQCYWLCWIERRWHRETFPYHYFPGDDFNYWARPSLGVAYWQFRPHRSSADDQPARGE